VPLEIVLRLATGSARHGTNLVDVPAHRLEALRDAVDAAIRRRDEILTELEALKPPHVEPDPAPERDP
jgi:hypothetical protein